MKLIPESVNITNIRMLKTVVKAGIDLRLQEGNIEGFFGDFLRYVDVLDGTVRFYEFDKPGSEKLDWDIMKACFANAADLDTIVHYKYAVWKEGEGWRCVSGKESGLEYLWEFFEEERYALTDIATDAVQAMYDGAELTSYAKHVILTFFSRFEDWDQVIQKAEELRNVK